MIRKTLSRILDSIAFRVAKQMRGHQNTSADRTLQICGRMFAQQVRKLSPHVSLADAEFRVSSQFGEDGIIQYLIAQADVRSQSFVEFGVEDYSESNTRFLLQNNNWSGLVIDSSESHVRFIRSDPIFWRHDLTAMCSFVTAENIDELIRRRYTEEELGLLSIDIDGNDYWVWKAIRAVRPTVVVCEYNAVLGCRLPVTIPYQPNFERSQAHYSFLYFGASLPALCRVAEDKGYAFVGCGSAGVNAFFVRKDRLGHLRAISAEEGFVEAKFRESRDPGRRMSYRSGIERLRLIEELPLLDLRSGQSLPIRELFARELAARR